DGCAGILERLAAGDVVVVMVAVHEVLDWLVGHLADFVDIRLHHFRPAIADGIRSDDAILRRDEHRLVVAGAEDVDILRAVDLGGGVGRLLRSGDAARGSGEQAANRAFHDLPPPWWAPGKQRRAQFIPAGAGADPRRARTRAGARPP